MIATVCLAVAALGTVNYRWQRETAPGEWTDLADSVNSPYSIVTGSPRLNIRSYRPAGNGNDRCRDSTGSGTVVSPAASHTVCMGDHDLDGWVDGDDVIAFFEHWDAG